MAFWATVFGQLSGIVLIIWPLLKCFTGKHTSN